MGKGIRAGAILLLTLLVFACGSGSSNSGGSGGGGGHGGGGGGGSGTPATITEISPTISVATATQSVTVTGSGFDADTAVTVGTNPATCSETSATELQCTFPNNGGTAGSVDVTVANSGTSPDTLADAYSYTGVLTPPGIGSGNHVYCIVQSPKTLFLGTGAGANVYGQVFVEGLTDQSAAPTPVPGLTGQVGFGPKDADPTAVNFTWINGSNNSGFSSAPNNREYVAYLVVGTVNGDYDYAFRFSTDGDANHYYCDGDGSDNGYAVASAGKLTMALDSDGDGVPDDQDSCPNDPTCQ